MNGVATSINSKVCHADHDGKKNFNFFFQIRFNSGGTISPARSPALSRRYQNSPGLNPGLTPGLVGEHRKSKPNSTSPRKSAPPGQFKF